MPFVPLCAADDLVLPLSPDLPSMAVITSWMDARTWVARNPEVASRVAAIGPLRTRRGVDILVRNLLANPDIRVLVLDGKDLTPNQEVYRTIGALFDVVLFDEDARDHERALLSLGEDIRELFERVLRKQVLLLVRAHFPDDVLFGPLNLAFIPTVPREGGIVRHPPPTPVPRLGPLPLGDPGQRIVADTLEETWTGALREILRFGVDLPSQYGDTREVRCLVTVIRDPVRSVEDFAENILPCTREMLEDYARRYTDHVPPAGAPYSYGSRLRETLDQIQGLERALAKDPGSRALFLTPWYPDDLLAVSGQPCLVGLWFRVESGALHGTLVFRSHDLYGAWPLNLGGACIWLRELARAQHLEVGTLTCLSGSAHLYARDFVAAESAAGARSRAWRLDPRSTWVISRVSNGLRAEAMTQKEETLLVLDAKDTTALLSKIRESGLVTDVGHALWLGAEVQRLAEWNPPRSEVRR